MGDPCWSVLRNGRNDCSWSGMGSDLWKKYDVPVPAHIANQEDFDESKLPKFGTIVTIILIPLVLIVMSSVTNIVPALNFLNQYSISLELHLLHY